ncbi:MAG: hypothetical protein IT352_07545 [Gemmatimonadales bacterium]|nr:hypothetical protein [Gemmatimonadales bacterium]
MPAPDYLVQILGLLGKEETTYGSAVALATTADGIQLQFENRDYPAITMDDAYDGDLGPSVGNLGNVLRAAKSGRSWTYDAPTRAKGGNAAYSASVLPSIHRLLKASGFDAALTTTTGSEKYDYTPTAPGTTYTSLTTNLYAHGVLYAGVGVLADWSWEAPNNGPPTHRFKLNGYFSADASRAAAPTITYPLTSVQAPLASSVALTLGNHAASAVCYASSFALNREILPRVAQTASGGHLGFVPRGRSPEFKVTLEGKAFVGSPYTGANTFDPYKLEETGQNFAFQIDFGSTQYNRWRMICAQAQVVKAEPRVVNGVACFELTIRPYTSTPVAADDLTVRFD